MSSIHTKINAIYSLEQLSGGNTAVHRIHPMCKTIAAFAFIITVVSFGKYDFARMAPFIFYPALMISLAEIPNRLLLKRFFWTLPFCLSVGLFGLFYERGAEALATLLFRTYLCVTTVLILMAVTPFTELATQMRALKIPAVFVIMFEMTYRYIGVLSAEAVSMYTAYSLRAPRKKGVDIRHAGGFVGHLFLRSFDRAERIYSAMKCRGYSLQNDRRNNKKPRLNDILYCAAVCFCCGLFRFVDVVAWVSSLAGEAFIC